MTFVIVYFDQGGKSENPEKCKRFAPKFVFSIDAAFSKLSIRHNKPLELGRASTKIVNINFKCDFTQANIFD